MARSSVFYKPKTDELLVFIRYPNHENQTVYLIEGPNFVIRVQMKNPGEHAFFKGLVFIGEID